MKQVFGAATGALTGFFTAGPLGALYGAGAGLVGGHMVDTADRTAKSQKRATARVELQQRRTQGEADNERKRLLQESSGIGGGSMLRRRGPLTSYAGRA